MGLFDGMRKRAMNRMLDRVVEEYSRQWQHRVNISTEQGGRSLTPEWLAVDHSIAFRYATHHVLPERVRLALPLNHQVNGALQQTCVMRACVDYELDPSEVQRAFEQTEEKRAERAAFQARYGL